MNKFVRVLWFIMLVLDISAVIVHIAIKEWFWAGFFMFFVFSIAALLKNEVDDVIAKEDLE